MRKNVIALILLLPLLFVLAVFSSVNTASLGIPVSANGVEILDRPEDDVYRIDLSTYENGYSVKARVTPERASNREYVLKVEGDAVSVDESGIIHAEKTGEARIYAVSKDGGYQDSVRALVYSTKPYDFGFSLYPLGEIDALALQETADGYAAELETGSYSYAVKSLPEGSFSSAKIETEQGTAEIDRVSAKVLFPFSGETVLKLSLNGQRSGKPVKIEKRLDLKLKAPLTNSGIVVNGGNPALVLSKDTSEAGFYVEGEAFVIEQSAAVSESEIQTLSEGKYYVKVRFEEARDFVLELKTENGSEQVSFRFADFDFSLRSDLPVQSSGEASVIVNSPVSFYAVPSVPAQGISYVWRAPESVRLETDEDGSRCRVTAAETGEFELSVQAMRGEAPLDLFEKKIKITAVRQVSAAQFAVKTDLGLAQNLVLAGERYESGTPVPAVHALPLICYDGKGERTDGDMELRSSDETIAKIENGNLIPLSSGTVTLTASWQANESFGTNVGAKIEVTVIKEGVEVKTSPELYAAANAGKKVVLAGNILLGTDESGNPLSVSEREKLFMEINSTYNTEYYRNQGLEGKVKAALELKNDVYGNGYTLNAELLAAATDGTGKPVFFRGPLDFVRFGQVASVAAQDNICFLVRTDGVKLHNLTLLGCGDDLLMGEEGYDLTRLNLVGTVLEVNASMSLLNCRVRNGRTAVRVYGGNRSGEKYFCETLEELGDRAEQERIGVLIEGSILSQAREFLLKIGTNAALRSNAEEAEPDLYAENGTPLRPQTNDYAEDEAFYRRYVFTDVTLKDSVLETSGFFTIGVESNFSGDLLQAGGEEGGLKFEGWQGTGGTSFAGILRLKGDVRLYDWKELKLIDSSTLIETELPELKLDIAAMLEFVTRRYPEKYGEILDGGCVHGGIAFYGGGKNYSQLDRKEMNSAEDLKEYRVNISVLGEAEGGTGYLGQILPSAAGTQDFRFYLFGKDGENSLQKHKDAAANGKKYDGIKAIVP